MSTINIVVTGATRGFGKAVALKFANEISGSVRFGLTGRTSIDLEQTKSEILRIREGKDTVCDVVVVNDIILIIWH